MRPGYLAQFDRSPSGLQVAKKGKATLRYIVRAAIGMLVAGAFASPALADKLILQQDGISAYLPDGFACAEKVRLTFEGKSAEAFKSDRSRLEKLTGAARTALGFQCEGIKDILIKGIAGGQTVFAAVSSEGTGWELFDVPLDMVAETGQEQRPAAAASAQGQPAPNAPPTASAAEGLPIQGYKFPGLMSALYLGRMDEIPDDQNIRSLVGSVLRSFAELCGEQPVRVAALLPQYISPQLRKMQKDPMQGLGQLFKGLAQMRDNALDTGNLGGAMADFAEQYAAFSTEGIFDGRLLVARHGCLSPQYDRVSAALHRAILENAGREPDAGDQLILSRLMSPEYRTLNDIPDPEAELQSRRLGKMQQETRASCQGQFASAASFCGCVVEKMAAAKVADEVWQTASGKFLDITRYPHLRPVVAQCYGS